MHRFIATPCAGSEILDPLMAHIGAVQAVPVEAGDIELRFECYYGIGTFPVHPSDAMYRDEIIRSCMNRYGFDLTPYYYPEGGGDVVHLFDVTDLTARRSEEHSQRFRHDMLSLHAMNRTSHSPYFYIFIRPIQILVIVGLIYVLYLYLYSIYDYREDFQEEAGQEETRGTGEEF